ncbi:MAG TPA: DUF6624 domain-containing protein [Haloplasmataceae bacterium]
MIILNNDFSEIARELIDMVKKDLSMQEKLYKSNNLAEEYNPDLEKIHQENAQRLLSIIYEMGWPTVKKVGYEASLSAWTILQNAISCPELQRISVPILMELAQNKDIYPSEVAVLYDRICYFEMRPQKYGTQFDYDENDELSPWKIEDEDNVDIYRKQVGLPPLQDAINRMRELAKEYNEKPNLSYNERQKRRLEWAKRVGWIK